MNTDNRAKLNELSGKVIGAAQKVSSTLGCGFVEKVYENALAVELARRGMQFRQQASMAVRYEREVVGEYFADLVVEDTLVVELKAVRAFDPVHEAQCINYLRASGLPLCLLLNFGRPRLDVRRVINT